MSRTKNDYRNTFCGNCGNIGHTYKRCHLPITSCGVILYKTNEKHNHDNKTDNKYDDKTVNLTFIPGVKPESIA